MGGLSENGAYEIDIILKAIEHIFAIINNNITRKYLIRVSYLEIYNEKIHDLLDKDTKDIKLREDITGSVVVSVKEEITTTDDDVLNVMRKGNKNRKVAETKCNERSSRSHCIFRIIIESTEKEESAENTPVQVSHLNLVDLAGSERLVQTRASGIRLKEGSHINKSLSTLALVIKQLSENSDFINFRDSKLTRLLQDSLGGNAKTVIIATITPVSVDNGHSTLA